jgi:3-dehydroquinate synthase
LDKINAALIACCCKASHIPYNTTTQGNLGDKSYPIYIGQNLLNQKALLSKHIPGKQVMIVTNTTVAPLYLAKVIETFT